MFKILALISIFICVAAADKTLESITANNYHGERHTTVTSDGFVLGMYRLPYRRGDTSAGADRPVVFVMHGLLVAADSFLHLGPEYGIGYNLADAGFDVWMGNARGTRDSREHLTLDPKDQKSEYFDYSFEEIGIYDVAAMIDYVLEFTGKKNLHYVGHSQGGTSFLVLASSRPEYNDKIASAHLLAGVGYQGYFPNKIIQQFAERTDLIYLMAVGMGVLEIPPLQWFSSSAQCSGDDAQKYICEVAGIKEIMQYDSEEGSIFDYRPAGSSIKQLAHFGQNINSQNFARWDYGIIRNRLVYGTIRPPLYDLGLITANVVMHYTVNDFLQDEQDVLAMAAQMPNTVTRKVPDEQFTHEGFMFDKNVKPLVTDYIIEAIRNHK